MGTFSSCNVVSPVMVVELDLVMGFPEGNNLTLHNEGWNEFRNPNFFTF